MITVNFSKNELEAVIAGLREREDKMYSNSLIYRNDGNKAAQSDCLAEMKNAQQLRERLETCAKD